MNIDMKPVKSSQIEEMGYDKDSQTLAIRFRNGRKVYHYQGVPQTVADGFTESESAGRYFSGAVKGKFKHALQPEKKSEQAQHGQS